MLHGATGAALFRRQIFNFLVALVEEYEWVCSVDVAVEHAVRFAMAAVPGPFKGRFARHERCRICTALEEEDNDVRVAAVGRAVDRTPFVRRGGVHVGTGVHQRRN